MATWRMMYPAMKATTPTIRHSIKAALRAWQAEVVQRITTLAVARRAARLVRVVVF
jgi:hypothetical protein